MYTLEQIMTMIKGSNFEWWYSDNGEFGQFITGENKEITPEQIKQQLEKMLKQSA